MMTKNRIKILNKSLSLISLSPIKSLAIYVSLKYSLKVLKLRCVIRITVLNIYQKTTTPTKSSHSYYEVGFLSDVLQPRK